MAQTETDTPRPARGQELAAVQYRRLLKAVMRACAEQESADVAVEDIITAAGMSRRTFYDLFRDSEECFVAALEAGYAHVLRAARTGYDADPEQAWDLRVRAALVEVFGLFDAQPDLAQLCLVYARGGGDRAVDLHQAFVGRFATTLQDTARASDVRDEVPDELAPLLIGAIVALVQGHLSEHGTHVSLQTLVGTLMYSVCIAYEGPEAAARESRRPPGAPLHDWSRLDWRDLGPPALRPESLRPELVERTLLFLVVNPRASNTQVAHHLSVSSKTIARHLSWLADRGLITAHGGRATRNAWEITPAGADVLRTGGGPG